MSPIQRLPRAAVLMLPSGKLELLGRLTAASNATFLAVDQAHHKYCYKPVAGERPLWDFPEHTLARREVAAYQISRAAGFDVVPETGWGTGPLGEGSLQRWIDGEVSDLVDLVSPEEMSEQWRSVATGLDPAGEPVVLVHRADERLRRIAVFDLVINNTDRKAGHILADGDRVYGVDHGVSLHTDDKVRTVLWGFAGEPLSADERVMIATCRDLPLPEGLTTAEWDAMRHRAARLLGEGRMPVASGQWPAIPWPAW
ncbi:MAG: SCO1664 family protein [Arachnia sp.]